MEKWKVKCIGCGKKISIICQNCNRQEFKEMKQENYYLTNWLECLHCKEKLTDIYHQCVGGSYFQNNDRSSTTSFDKHKENFFKSNSWF